MGKVFGYSHAWIESDLGNISFGPEGNDKSWYANPFLLGQKGEVDTGDDYIGKAPCQEIRLPACTRSVEKFREAFARIRQEWIDGTRNIPSYHVLTACKWFADSLIAEAEQEAVDIAP